ncbi:MAG TPA: hypothetical protein VIT92_02775 [Burkholderiaceae bacterium]
MKALAHAAGAAALALTASMFVCTMLTVLLFDQAMLAQVRLGVLYGSLSLLPLLAFAAVGARSRDGMLAERKLRRMGIVGFNALLLLAPIALLLYVKASAGNFDAAFYLIQGGELLLQMLQLQLLALNMHDGLLLAGRLRPAVQAERRRHAH